MTKGRFGSTECTSIDALLPSLVWVGVPGLEIFIVEDSDADFVGLGGLALFDDAVFRLLPGGISCIANFPKGDLARC